jgi:hypothetical protein
VSFVFLHLQEFRRDCESRERFDEDLPGWENHIGGQREDMGEESRSFRGGLARGLPGRLQQIERGVPGEEALCMKNMAKADRPKSATAILPSRPFRGPESRRKRLANPPKGTAIESSIP